jgi:hypothetical protein
MTYNILVWRWAPEYADRKRQRRERLTHTRVAQAFAPSGEHFAAGDFDQEAFLTSIHERFPDDEVGKPFVVERYPRGIIFNYGGRVRFDIVPVIGGIAKSHGLNSTEV